MIIRAAHKYYKQQIYLFLWTYSFLFEKNIKKFPLVISFFSIPAFTKTIDSYGNFLGISPATRSPITKIFSIRWLLLVFHPPRTRLLPRLSHPVDFSWYFARLLSGFYQGNLHLWEFPWYFSCLLSGFYQDNLHLRNFPWYFAHLLPGFYQGNRHIREFPWYFARLLPGFCQDNRLIW